MRKLAIYLLDTLIFLALVWFFLFRNIFSSFSVFLATSVALLSAVAVFAHWSNQRKEKSEQKRKANEQKLAELQTEKLETERLQQEQAALARRELLAKEHEARRPVCFHCERKTEGVFQHRRIDGTPDRRYRENPLLCNRCFRSYQPIRPWNLPQHEKGAIADQRANGAAEPLAQAELER